MEGSSKPKLNNPEYLTKIAPLNHALGQFVQFYPFVQKDKDISFIRNLIKSNGKLMNITEISERDEKYLDDLIPGISAKFNNWVSEFENPDLTKEKFQEIVNEANVLFKELTKNFQN